MLYAFPLLDVTLDSFERCVSVATNKANKNTQTE